MGTSDTEDAPQRLRDLARLRGYRAMLFVPLMQKSSGAGLICVTRAKPGQSEYPQEVALLKTFADQAVIAIENARLFNETQEALDQQKASAEVLGAISKSVADTSPVFEAILDACERAVRRRGDRHLHDRRRRHGARRGLARPVGR